ncbi:MAG: hypothetical protein AB8E82_11100 [Aureispira sp.]
MIHRAFLFFSILMIGTLATAQSTLTNGYIKYNISVDSDLPIASFLSMGTTLEVAFKGQKTKAVAKVAGGTNTVQAVADHQVVKGLSLLDVMGEKKAIKLGSSDYQKAKEGIEKLAKNPMRATESTKTIAGYSCQKILMKDKQTGANIILYVTKKINPKGDALAQQLIKAVQGFPLEVIVRQDATTVRLTASTVTGQTPSDGAFSQNIPSDYEVTTLKEIEAEAQRRAQEQRQN